MRTTESEHVCDDGPSRPESESWPETRYRTDSKPYCDVVMKGGVTSGVVYPLTICQIAAQYVIRHIGGTSVGAIAAALAAAAEYRRRGPGGTGDGYAQLAQLPKFLRTEGTLEALFAADDDTAPYLAAALAAVEDGKTIWQRAAKIAGIVLRGRSTVLLVLAFALLVVIDPLTWLLLTPHGCFSAWPRWAVAAVVVLDVLLALPGAVLSALVLAFFWAWRCLEVTGTNGFGWAHGHRDAGAAAPPPVAPLIDWLTVRIQTAAGLDANRPLTFGDLWRAGLADGEPQTLGDEREIDLAMVTTCLTLNRPFRLPFDVDDIDWHVPNDAGNDRNASGDKRPALYFREDELARYFPPAIMSYLTDAAVCPVDTTHSGVYVYRRFPAASQLPVVVAMRLSMSFPILFSAVKLYAPDMHGDLQPVWFSDGGLTSNMPIHFFDGPLPRWPTFAIDLLGSEPTKKPSKKPNKKPIMKPAKNFDAGDVFIEGDILAQRIEPWDRLDDSLVQFVGAIIETARTWQDRLLGHMPGYADRTVGIRLHPNEGGLLLTMPPPMIDRLTKRGDCAGQVLLQRFPTDPKKRRDGGWPGQRWTRYRNVMAALDEWLGMFGRGYDWPDPTAPPYPRTIETTTAPVRYSTAQPWGSLRTAQHAKQDADAVDALRRRWYIPRYETGAAKPIPHLRSRPRF